MYEDILQPNPTNSKARSSRLNDNVDGINSFRYGIDSVDDGAINFWQILDVLRKWWWLIALIAIVASSFTALQMSRITPMFMAQVDLQVKQSERNITGADVIETIDADREFLNTQIELLQSEGLAEKVIDSLQLLSDPDFSGLTDNSNAVPVGRDQKMRRAVEIYNKRLSVVSVEGSRLIYLKFVHSDPRKAALIANTIAEQFIESDLQGKYDATNAARSFLEDRLSVVKSSLEKAERDLAEYASSNDILLISETDEATGTLDKSELVLLNNELAQARSARQQAQQAYEASLDSNFNVETLNNPELNELRKQVLELNAEYVEKRAIFKPSYPDMIDLKNRIDFFNNSISEQTTGTVEANRAQVKSEYNAAKAKEDDLESRVNRLKRNVVDLRERSIDYTILKRQVDIERTQYEGLLLRLKEISVSDDIGTSLVRIVDIAKPAEKPFKPNKTRAIIFALLISSILSFAFAFIIELIDDRIKQPEDIKTKLNMVIMGVSPYVKNTLSIPELLFDSQSSISEAYASLRTNLQFSAMNGGPRVIQITSTQPGEGKSVSSLGLALRFAGLGEKTILIDADMRRPTFLTSDASAIGLSGLLTQDTEIGQHIKPTKFSNLDLITSGLSVPNPSEILSSTRFDEIIAYARENYAYIIIDSPPVIGLADAPILGAKVDASLLVVETNRLRTRSIKSAIDRLSLSGTHIVGVVLTKYKAPKAGYSYYKYSYSTPEKSESNSKTRGARKADSKQKFSLE